MRSSRLPFQPSTYRHQQVVHLNQPRFRGVGVSPITRLFLFFDTQYEPGFILATKAFGSVPPRIAITRDKTERNEAIVHEALQIAGFFGLMPIVSGLFNPIQGMMANVSADKIRMHNETAFKSLSQASIQRIKVAKIGKSLGVLTFLALVKMAIPHMRNLYTIKATGLSRFTEVTGLSKPDPNSPQAKRNAKEAERKTIRSILTYVSAGAVGALAIMLAAGQICRSGKNAFASKGLLNPKRLETLFSNFALIGKNSNQISALTKSPAQTMWFWAAPFFIGLFAGCRDKYEIPERLSMLTTFLLGYVTVPKVIEKTLKRLDGSLLTEVKKYIGKEALPKHAYAAVLQENLISDKNLAQRYIRHLDTKHGLSLLASLLVTGTLPLVFNVIFTKWRYQRDQQMIQKQSHQPSRPVQSAAGVPPSLSNYPMTDYYYPMSTLHPILPQTGTYLGQFTAPSPPKRSY